MFLVTRWERELKSRATRINLLGVFSLSFHFHTFIIEVNKLGIHLNHWYEFIISQVGQFKTLKFNLLILN